MGGGHRRPGSRRRAACRGARIGAASAAETALNPRARAAARPASSSPLPRPSSRLAAAAGLGQLVPLRLGVTVPPSLRPGEMLDVVVPAGRGVGPGYPGKVRVRVPNRLGPARSLEVDVWTARLAGARG